MANQELINKQLEKDRIAKVEREKRQENQNSQQKNNYDSEKINQNNKTSEKNDADNKEILIKEKGIRKAISTPLGESKNAIKIRNRIAILEENFYPSESEIYRAALIALEKMNDDQIRKIVKNLSKKELDWSK